MIENKSMVFTALVNGMISLIASITQLVLLSSADFHLTTKGVQRKWGQLLGRTVAHNPL